MLSRLFIVALWSVAGKVLTTWLLFVMFIVCVFFFIIFPCGILGQWWNLIVWFPDLCHLNFVMIICLSGAKLFALGY